jgi:hypothetical protein
MTDNTYSLNDDLLLHRYFAQPGIMTTDGSGTYDVIEHGVGFLKRDGSGTLSYESTVLTDDKFITSGIMTTDGSGEYDVIEHGVGFLKRDGSGGFTYENISIGDMDGSANNGDVLVWDASGGEWITSSKLEEVTAFALNLIGRLDQSDSGIMTTDGSGNYDVIQNNAEGFLKRDGSSGFRYENISIGDLSDVDGSANVVDGYVLIWSNDKWIPSSISLGETLAGTNVDKNSVENADNGAVLTWVDNSGWKAVTRGIGDLSDVDKTSINDASIGDVLVWDASGIHTNSRLSQALLASADNGDILVWDSTTSKWDKSAKLNTVYNWGDHSLVGYITSSELGVKPSIITDPLVGGVWDAIARLSIALSFIHWHLGASDDDVAASRSLQTDGSGFTFSPKMITTDDYYYPPNLYPDAGLLISDNLRFENADLTIQSKNHFRLDLGKNDGSTTLPERNYFSYDVNVGGFDSSGIQQNGKMTYTVGTSINFKSPTINIGQTEYGLLGSSLYPNGTSDIKLRAGHAIQLLCDDVTCQQDLYVTRALSVNNDFGQPGQVLMSNGINNAMSWTTLNSGGASSLNDLSDVNVSSNVITFGSADTTGILPVNDNGVDLGSTAKSFKDAHIQGILYATTLNNGVSLTLPTTDGTDGQVLQTDGSGVLSWASNLAALTGACSTIDTENLTPSRVLISNTDGKVAVSTLTDTELSYLNGVTSDIQNQINVKAPLESPTFTGTPSAPTATAGDSSTQLATTAFVTTAVDNLVGGAPGALDTLNELAAAINDDENYAASITTALSNKQDNLTFGIANTNAVKIDDVNVISAGNYAKFTANGIEGRSYDEVKSDLSLNNVENTALSTWPGSGNIVNVGSISLEKLDQVNYTVKTITKTSLHPYYGDASNSGYEINGHEAAILMFVPGKTYRFDMSDSSNQGHPLKFYLDVDKNTGYTNNVTESGTAGNSNAYVEIVITDSTPTKIFYQCGNHPKMGNYGLVKGYANLGNINVNENTITSTDSNGNINISPDGTGAVKITSNVETSGTLLVDEITSKTTGSNVSIYPLGTGGTAGNIILHGLTWPAGDGTDGQVLQTDGSGVLSWASNLAALTGAGSTIATENLTPSRVLISNTDGKVAVSTLTDTQLSYLNGVTSDIQNQINVKAPLESPTFTGTPLAPTATAGDSSTQLATTAFVTTAVDNLVGGAPGALDTLNELAAAINDDENYAASITTALATKQANLTFGIADTNAVKIDDANVISAGNYAKFTANGIEGKSYAEVKSDLSLNNVENTALSSWTGSNNITTVGQLESLYVDNIQLDGNIISTGPGADINLILSANGSGVVEIKGNTAGSGQIQLNCEDNSHGIKIKGPPHSAGANYTLTLPNDDGTDGQVLKTDGSGNLSWTTPSSGATGTTDYNNLTNQPITTDTYTPGVYYPFPTGHPYASLSVPAPPAGIKADNNLRIAKDPSISNSGSLLVQDRLEIEGVIGPTGSKTATFHFSGYNHPLGPVLGYGRLNANVANVIYLTSDELTHLESDQKVAIRIDPAVQQADCRFELSVGAFDGSTAIPTTNNMFESYQTIGGYNQTTGTQQPGRWWAAAGTDASLMSPVIHIGGQNYGGVSGLNTNATADIHLSASNGVKINDGPLIAWNSTGLGSSMRSTNDFDIMGRDMYLGAVGGKWTETSSPQYNRWYWGASNGFDQNSRDQGSNYTKRLEIGAANTFITSEPDANQSNHFNSMAPSNRIHIAAYAPAWHSPELILECDKDQTDVDYSGHGGGSYPSAGSWPKIRLAAGKWPGLHEHQFHTQRAGYLHMSAGNSAALLSKRIYIGKAKASLTNRNSPLGLTHDGYGNEFLGDNQSGPFPNSFDPMSGNTGTEILSISGDNIEIVSQNTVQIHGPVSAQTQVLNSDDRLKHNEEDLTNSLEVIRKLKPQKYQKTKILKEADFNGILEEGSYINESGFIAQDILNIPELAYCVSGGDFTKTLKDSEGVEKEVNIEKAYSLNYNDIFTVNVSATQELDAIVTNLLTKIDTLEARIIELENK